MREPPADEPEDECSAEYPIGSGLEPYDIARDRELTK